MGLPQTVRVKLSSEEAGYLSVTPVVVRQMPLRELVELMLGVAGKDVERIRELLAGGTLVRGATRFRWEGFEADRAGLRELLAGFPDPEPERRFDAARCFRVVFGGPEVRIEISREAGAKRRWLRRSTFWDVLLELAGQANLRYREYSYRERADCYRLALEPALVARLRAQADLLRYSVLADRLRAARFDHVDFFVARG